MEGVDTALVNTSEPDGQQVKASSTLETNSPTVIKEVTSDTTSDCVSDDALTESTDSIVFVIVFNKQKLEVKWNVHDTIASLKTHLHTLTGVPPALQKLMFKGGKSMNNYFIITFEESPD